MAVARCARAEGGRLPAPFAGAVEGARAGPEPHYGHYSLHVSLVAIVEGCGTNNKPNADGLMRGNEVHFLTSSSRPSVSSSSGSESWSRGAAATSAMRSHMPMLEAARMRMERAVAAEPRLIAGAIFVCCY